MEQYDVDMREAERLKDEIKRNESYRVLTKKIEELREIIKHMNPSDISTHVLRGKLSGTVRKRRMVIIYKLTEYVIPPKARSAYYCRAMQHDLFGISLSQSTLHKWYGKEERGHADRRENLAISPENQALVKAVYKSMV